MLVISGAVPGEKSLTRRKTFSQSSPYFEHIARGVVVLFAGCIPPPAPFFLGKISSARGREAVAVAAASTRNLNIDPPPPPPCYFSRRRWRASSWTPAFLTQTVHSFLFATLHRELCFLLGLGFFITLFFFFFSNLWLDGQ